MIKSSILLIAVIMMISVLSCYAAEKPESVDYLIITGKNTNTTETIAASDLSKYISKITGKSVRVNGKMQKGNICTFLIGNTISNPMISKLNKLILNQIDKSTLGNDGFVLKSLDDKKGKVVLIFGNTSAAVLYGVYDYLERFCNAGFFMDGDYVPKLKAVPVTGLNFTSKPWFRDRGFYTTGTYLKKYGLMYRSVDEVEQFVSWMAKRKLNQDRQIFGESPNSSGIVAVKVYGYDTSKPEESYGSGWPTGWNFPPEYNTKWIKDWMAYARARGMKILSCINLGYVPKQFRDKHPELPYMPNMGYGINMLNPDSKEFKEYSARFIKEIIIEYGTDHLYEYTPFSEMSGAKTPEEAFNVKLNAAKKFCDFMQEIDPQYIWCSGSWGFLATPDIWTPERIERYINGLPKDKLIFWDDAGNWNSVYAKLNYFYGLNWAFGILHGNQGNDELNGNLKDLYNRLKNVTHDPKANKLVGIYHIPEAIGHNILYFHLTTEMSWNPNIGYDEFLDKYCLTRYGVKSSKKMLDCTKKVIDAVYSSSNTNSMYYQTMGITWWNGLTPLYDNLNETPAGRQTELRRQIPLMEEAVKIALTELDNQKGNKLYENDLVDYTKTILGLKSNYYLLDAYKAFKAGDKTGFENASQNVLKCIDAIKMIISTRPDYSVAKMMREIMSVSGVNPMLPKMIRQGMINDSYAATENYEQLVLNYRPKVEAYLSEMRTRMSKGTNTLVRSDMDKVYNEIDNKWVLNEAVVSADKAYKGSAIQAIKMFYSLLPFNENTGSETYNKNPDNSIPVYDLDTVKGTEKK